MDGSTVGERYEVEARIGAGGMAEVFRGTDPVLSRTVAIKVLLPQFARDASFVARFRREAQAAARLNHPNIVGVFDTGADGDTQYIVMEFVEGRTLADVLASGRKPTTMQAVELAQKIAMALAAAHAQGIVHRDIKPANVMVTREGKVKVMDFGIARVETVETAPQTSSVLGTPTYLSPEQAQGLKVDARSDIYSLGVVLYELLAGKPPFTGDSPVAIAYKQVNEAPVPPSLTNPDVAPQLDAVVMKALAKNPANRYQSAEELGEDLERVRQGQDVQATPLMPAGGDATQVIARPPATMVLPPTEPEGGARRTWVGVLIGALIVALLAGAGYLLATSLGGTDDPALITVDDYRGEQFNAVQKQLEDAGALVVAEPIKERTDDVPRGEIMDQDPQPGTQVEEGATITFTVAAPIKLVEVPDLLGDTLAEAEIELEAAGLTLGAQTTGTSDTYETGEIMAQDPPAGDQVNPNTTEVNVTVVDNPELVTVGDYTCKNFEAAQNQVQHDGLVAVFAGTRPLRPECPNPNFVALQDPATGSEVAPGSQVLLYTGEEAPPPTTPPTSTETPSA